MALDERIPAMINQYYENDGLSKIPPQPKIRRVGRVEMLGLELGE
jgi:hypothetical protein